MTPTATRAVILRLVDYGEADRILTLLTERLGKVGAMARRARSSQRRYGGALEPLALIEVELAPARRGDLLELTSSRVLEPHLGLAADLARFSAASYLVELTRECEPEHQPDPSLFGLVAEALRLLAGAQRTEVPALALAAELGILSHAGVEVSLTRCNACGRPVPEHARVRFDPARGGVVCTPCGGGPIALSSRAQSLASRLIAGPLAAAAGVSTGDEQRAALAELEEVLAAFVDFHLGKRLKSRAGF